MPLTKILPAIFRLPCVCMIFKLCWNIWLNWINLLLLCRWKWSASPREQSSWWKLCSQIAYRVLEKVNWCQEFFLAWPFRKPLELSIHGYLIIVDHVVMIYCWHASEIMSSFILRFTRPERLGSEAKIKCSQCQTYQVSVWKATLHRDTNNGGSKWFNLRFMCLQ